jgi:hypothetical protein
MRSVPSSMARVYRGKIGNGEFSDVFPPYFSHTWLNLCKNWDVCVQGSKLDQKVQQLLDWNTRRSVITLSSEKFSSYVRTKPRNYSVIATFTALKPQRQCSVCK